MNPNIQVFHLVEGARNATGLTVIIDVCRAFSTAAFLASRGVNEIFAVGTIQEAFQLREQLHGCLLIGEVNGRKPEGFDFGNSPSEILKSRPYQKRAIQRTSAGTQGIINAEHADEILTGAFVNAAAIIRYIQETKPRTLSLVCMGREAERECVEDTLCSEFLGRRLLGNEMDFSEVAERIRRSETGEKFRNSAYPWFPEIDLELCLSLDLFDFVLRSNPKMAIPCLQRVKVDCRNKT